MTAAEFIEHKDNVLGESWSDDKAMLIDFFEEYANIYYKTLSASTLRHAENLRKKADEAEEAISKL